MQGQTNYAKNFVRELMYPQAFRSGNQVVFFYTWLGVSPETFAGNEYGDMFASETQFDLFKRENWF
jgi:hypothetical protein